MTAGQSMSLLKVFVMKFRLRNLEIQDMTNSMTARKILPPVTITSPLASFSSMLNKPTSTTAIIFCEVIHLPIASNTVL